MTDRNGARQRIQSIAKIFVALACFAFLSAPQSAAQTGQIPQIPAFLPTVDQVGASQVMPLDGTWLISSIRKKIRIEAGRAYAVDGWTHLFVLNIQPGMVVIKDIVPTGPGAYQGEDLPLMGKWTAKVLPNRSLAVTVAGTFGPASYTLIPVQIDNPQWYGQEMEAAGLTVPASAPSAKPAYQFTNPNGGGSDSEEADSSDSDSSDSDSSDSDSSDSDSGSSQ